MSSSKTSREKLNRLYNSPEHLNDMRRTALRKYPLMKKERIQLYEEEVVYLNKRMMLVLRRLRKLKTNS